MEIFIGDYNADEGVINTATSFLPSEVMDIKG
jgi:hypothetical protein